VEEIALLDAAEMACMRSLKYLTICLCLSLAWPAGEITLGDETRSRAEPTTNAPQQDQLDSRVSELIEQLGDSEFAVREKAENELRRIGLAAFDALEAAQDHRDLEIGMRARYLRRSANVAWVLDTDPPAVKPILRGYGTQQVQERSSRLEKLARLEDRQGWPALCRLVRFETEEILSKRAALAMITQTPPAAEEAAEVATLVQSGVAQSKRRGAEWLRRYAQWLGDPVAVSEPWSRLVDEEFELLAGNEAKTDGDIVTALARWHAESLQQRGEQDAAAAVVKKLAALLDGAQEKLLAHVDWLGHREMWSFVLDAYARHADTFDSDPILLYRLAEAQRKLGDAAAAGTAERALGLSGKVAQAHIQAGFALAERGLFDWAEAEYRAVLENEEGDDDNGIAARVRFLLSEMLHDQQRPLEAAQILQPLVEALEKEEVQELIEVLGRDPGGIKSRMHYFFALDLLKQNKTAEAVKHLEQGAEEDPTDADVIIALYRLPEPTAELRAKTQRLLREATEKFQQDIADHARELAESQGQAQNEAIANHIKQQLAMAHNQLAWLVGNTEGDYDAAVTSSHESLRLRPATSAYLDTLGRCYYAKGDLASAIKYQSEALRLDPHSGQMKRQLELFQAEAAKAKQE
jgi:tetratricopeptide (TPR) repeat protein